MTICNLVHFEVKNKTAPNVSSLLTCLRTCLRVNHDKHSVVTVALNGRYTVAVKIYITSSITTVVYMLGHRTRLISCIVSLSALGLSTTFTVSRIVFHVGADADQLTTLLTAGQSCVRFVRCRGVRYWATELLIDLCPVPAATDPRTADTLSSSNTDCSDCLFGSDYTVWAS